MSDSRRLEDAIGEMIVDPRVICPRIYVRLVAVDRNARTVTVDDRGREEVLPIGLFVTDASGFAGHDPAKCAELGGACRSLVTDASGGGGEK